MNSFFEAVFVTLILHVDWNQFFSGHCLVIEYVGILGSNASDPVNSMLDVCVVACQDSVFESKRTNSSLVNSYAHSKELYFD